MNWAQPWKHLVAVAKRMSVKLENGGQGDGVIETLALVVASAFSERESWSGE